MRLVMIRLSKEIVLATGLSPHVIQQIYEAHAEKKETE